jgi:hypothetical protein
MHARTLRQRLSIALADHSKLAFPKVASSYFDPGDSFQLSLVLVARGFAQ